MQKAPGCSHPPCCWWITHPSGRCGTAPGDVLLPKFSHRSLILLDESGLLAKPHGVRQVHHLFPAGEVLMEGWHEGKEGSVLAVPEGLLPQPGAEAAAAPWGCRNSVGRDGSIPGASQTRALSSQQCIHSIAQPNPGCLRNTLALCLSSTSVATSMHSWPMRWQCPAGKRPGRLTGWQGRVWRSCAGRAQGAWDGRVALRWVPGCGFVIHAERLVLPLDLLGGLHRHQLIPSFPKPPRQQPALIQLLAAPALLQVLLQAHLGSPCAPSPKRNRRPPGREHRGGDPLRSPLPC